MKKFDFVSTIKPGGFDFGGDYNRDRFIAFTKKHIGARMGHMLLTPESSKQRDFYHGAVIPLIAFFQDGMSHRNSRDCDHIHEWMKLEFAPEMISIGGKMKKVPGSSKGKLTDGYLDNVIDFLEENYGVKRQEVLDVGLYKKWKDEIYPNGGPDTFIDYMVEMNILKLP